MLWLCTGLVPTEPTAGHQPRPVSVGISLLKLGGSTFSGPDLAGPDLAGPDLAGPGNHGSACGGEGPL